MVVDTGAFLTVLDQQFAREAKLGGYETGQYARGFGTKARPIRVTQFPEFKVGNFVIKNASVTIWTRPGFSGAPGASLARSACSGRNIWDCMAPFST